MRKTILAGLIAASLVPAVAQAQVISPRERAELRSDRRDIREERRDLQDARRYGNQRDIREQRQDVREARQEFREDRRDARRDWGRDDWRGYRNTNRNLYYGGNWRSDYRYQAFRPGVRIGVGYYQPRYVIADPWRYRLPQARYSQRWVRHYNDVLLVDTRSGIVVSVYRNFYL